jgi:uncharacterized protein (TIGR02996 family)
VSLVHFEPDVAVTPCLGCNELIAELDLVRSTRTVSSGIFWYPYHFWCLRDQPPPPRPLSECAECGGTLAVDDALIAMAWADTFTKRVRRRLLVATSPLGDPRDEPENTVARPPAWRCVSVGQGHLQPAAAVDAFPEPERERSRVINGWFEVVHDICPVDDPLSWRARLRDDPDHELRIVYADWLEQIGDLPHAELVRVAVERHRTTGAQQTVANQRLRELRKVVSGSWCRDVCARLSQ